MMLTSILVGGIILSTTSTYVTGQADISVNIKGAGGGGGGGGLGSSGGRGGDVNTNIVVDGSGAIVTNRDSGGRKGRARLNVNVLGRRRTVFV